MCKTDADIQAQYNGNLEAIESNFNNDLVELFTELSAKRHRNQISWYVNGFHRRQIRDPWTIKIDSTQTVINQDQPGD